MRSSTKQATAGRIETRQSRRTEVGRAVADGHGPFGLARATDDAGLEGVGSRLRNVCGGYQPDHAPNQSTVSEPRHCDQGFWRVPEKRKGPLAEAIDRSRNTTTPAWLYEQLDQVRELRKRAKAAVLSEGKHHKAVQLLRTIPQVGPIRAAQIVASAGTPHRFRTKRQFWSYSGLAVVTHTS